MTMNIIQAEKASGNAVPEICGASAVSADFLRDESRMEGKSDFAAFPTSTEEASAVMKWAFSKGLELTVSGGRTGISGGAVPAGGLLLSLCKMKKAGKIFKDSDGKTLVRCEAGLSLAELQNYLIFEKSGCFFPPDPTETTASIGGMIACNASGAHTFRYGPTRKFVNGLTAVLVNGDIVRIRRNDSFAADDGGFVLRFSDGHEVSARIPSYSQPLTKNAAGYYSGRGMDLIDIFIGSEGTLALITEAELILLPKPESEFNAMFFLSSEDAAVELTEKLRSEAGEGLTAIEYFDPAALGLLRERRLRMGPASAVPPGVPQDKNSAGIYLDIASEKIETAQIAERISGIARKLKHGHVLAEWAAFDRDERERLRKFRHALPETVNSIIAERRKSNSAITKLGTDMAVPDEFLETILKTYRKELDANSLEYVIFGHIGNNHLHVNILPSNTEEYTLGKKLYADFARTVLSMNGSISAEHGIGKLKKNFLAMMLGEKGIEEMKNLKKAFDPDFRLGKGTLF